MAVCILQSVKLYGKMNYLKNQRQMKGKPKMTTEYLKAYFEQTATHNYILGVAKAGRVKAYFVTLDLDGYEIIFNEKPTTASRQTVIKYRSNKVKVAYLESKAVRVIDLMGEEELKNSRRTKINRKGKPYTENCGECFEWLLAEMFGGSQNEKSNLKHTEGGDLVIDGISYQVKYEKGAITVSL